ncbi:hypothetical protein [Teichococcus oryzae]|uniref:Transcription elongation factor GreA/GreB C-terminal domain-containing protein n=1 Tax=Teichococcus oryzae TaxID=1608942 RepID=A0A5B2TFL5_9PROT|nr:hypothetical protein [Pseudoroseomonas oryzae]KAA2212969.1 hypothetical protein F0Q34_12665 [Pseudoroseomonas oryzae]
MAPANTDCPFCGEILDAISGTCPGCGGPAAALPWAAPGEIIITERDHRVLGEIVCGPMRAGDLAARILMEKLECGRVVPAEEAPADLVTLGARVIFSLDGATAEARVLVHPDARSVSAWSLPVTAARGAALLGLRAGAETRAPRLRGGTECIEILSVRGQAGGGLRRAVPAAATRGITAPVMLRPRAKAGRLRPDDDPPPSAA